MKRVLFLGAALQTFCSFYGQQNELKGGRLTAYFEKQWSTAIAFTPSEDLEATEGNTNNYHDHIASFAPVFLEISLDGQKPRKALPRPFEMHVFILRHKD